MLRPYKRNSRKHSDAQVEQIAESIRRFGFLSPVLIDAEDGIIAGHGRVLAAKRLGMGSVPCLRIEHLTDEQKRAYIIADNRIAELSSWDRDALKEEMAALGESIDLGFLDLGEFVISGYDDAETDAHAAPEPSVSEGGSSAIDEIFEKPKPDRNVFPLVLPLSKKLYQQWQEMKKNFAMTDTELLEHLMEIE